MAYATGDKSKQITLTGRGKKTTPGHQELGHLAITQQAKVLFIVEWLAGEMESLKLSTSVWEHLIREVPSWATGMWDGVQPLSSTYFAPSFRRVSVYCWMGGERGKCARGRFLFRSFNEKSRALSMMTIMIKEYFNRVTYQCWHIVIIRVLQNKHYDNCCFTSCCAVFIYASSH